MKLTVQGDELSPTASPTVPTIPTILESDEDNVVLGRQPARGLCVNHPTVSREHARIFRRGTEFQVADLNSSNGTFVNGTKVTRSPLRTGDTLRLGSVDLLFEADRADADVPVPRGASDAPAPADDDDGIRLEDPSGADDEIQLEDPNPIEQTLIAMPSRTPAAPPRPVASRPAAGPKRIASVALARGRGGGGGGVLKQDLAQQSFGQKLLLTIFALAIAAAVFFVVQKMTESVVPEGGLPPAIDEGIDLTDEPGGAADGG